MDANSGDGPDRDERLALLVDRAGFKYIMFVTITEFHSTSKRPEYR